MQIRAISETAGRPVEQRLSQAPTEGAVWSFFSVERGFLGRTNSESLCTILGGWIKHESSRQTESLSLSLSLSLCYVEKMQQR